MKIRNNNEKQKYKQFKVSSGIHGYFNEKKKHNLFSNILQRELELTFRHNNSINLELTYPCSTGFCALFKLYALQRYI